MHSVLSFPPHMKILIIKLIIVVCDNRYQLAESLDAQLKRMGQDLKEIIDRINSSNAKPDPDDPVSLVIKVDWNDCMTDC